MFFHNIAKRLAVTATIIAISLLGMPVYQHLAPVALQPIAAAHAACTFPYTFQDHAPGGPREPIISGQVNDDFNALSGCITGIQTTVNQLQNLGTIPQVGTNALLQATSSAVGPAIIRVGFTVPGDVPATYYVPSNSACSLNGGLGDNGSQVKSADNKCWLAVFPDSGAPIEAWGADRSGAADSSGAITSAVQWACANARGITARDGTYKLVASGIQFTCNVNNVSFKGESYNTIFSYQGNNNVDAVIFAGPGLGKNNWAWQLGPFTVTSNGHASYGLHLTQMHHVQVDVDARNVVNAGVYTQFGVTNNYKVICSNNEGAFTTQPQNCFLTATDTVGGGLYNSNIWIAAEGMSGSGVKLATSNNNWFTGTSEGNTRGLELAADTFRNTFQSMDLESNSVQDALDNGQFNAYRDVLSCCTGRFEIGATTAGTIVDGGWYENITVDSGAGVTCTTCGGGAILAPIVLHPEVITNSYTMGSGVGTDVRVDFNGPWIPVAVTIGCQTGSLGGGSTATGKYLLSGKRVKIDFNLNIPAIGTCAGLLTASLPFTPATGQNPIIHGRDRGAGLGQTVSGTVDQGVKTIELTRADGTFAAVSGSVIDLSGEYELP